VVRNQRERLFGAMIAAVAEKGYEASTVADLVRISGVSRSDFYEHFANKDDCAVGALEAVLEMMRQIVLRSYDGEGGALRTLIELIGEQAATARFCFVEVYAAGPRAVAMIDAAAEPLEDLFERRFVDQEEGTEVPRQLVGAIVGGLRKVIHTRLYRGEEAGLVELAEQLRAWSLAYKAMPKPLPVPRRTSNPQLQFVGYTVSQRIARALASVVAEKGYGATSTSDIAERAAMSLSTFYAHFKNKEEATLATIELVGALVLATVGPTVRRGDDWRAGVIALHETLCAFLAAEPDFAQLTISEVYAAGPRALAQRDRIIEALQGMLAPGYAEHPETPAIAGEAIGGATYALLRDQLRFDGPASLPPRCR
jgi:AcrR family transcriptional regulator